MLNAPRSALDEITAILPGAGAPTVMPLMGRDDAVAVHAVCQEAVFWETLETAEGRRRLGHPGPPDREDDVMQAIRLGALDAAGRAAALARPRQRTEARVTDTVRDIFEDVAARGGQAVTDWSLKLDGAPPRRIALTPDVVAEARAALRPADTRSCASPPRTSASSTRRPARG
jgi:hypothetical protein